MTATTFIDPSDLPKPVGPYSQLVACDGPGRWVHVSGQVGVAEDGSTPPDMAGQSELAWGAIGKALAAAGMGMQHLVKTTTFLVDRADAAAMREVRLRHLAGARPASTLVIVQGLLDPAWKIEVEAVAFLPLAPI
jgi:enamine deaminase RidA (YjgF/YER057c/UK114 family)